MSVASSFLCWVCPLDTSASQELPGVAKRQAEVKVVHLEQDH